MLTRIRGALPSADRLTGYAIAVMAVVYFATRIWIFTLPTFHEVRQLHGAMNARFIYCQYLGGDCGQHLPTPLWLEPPVLDTMAALGYAIIGHEALCIGRGISAVCWFFSGLFLFAVLRHWTGRIASLTGLAVFFFHPFAVPASMSFQPDPLMILLITASWLATLRWRLAAQAALMALAVLVKPTCVFFVAPWHFFMNRTLSVHGRALAFAAAMVPAVVYNGWQIVFGGSMGAQAAMSFVPKLLVDWKMWENWAALVTGALCPVALVMALAGFLLCRSRMLRTSLMVLLISYAAFACVFTYHIQTHNYYSLPAVAIIALAIAALTDSFITTNDWLPKTLGVAIVVALAGYWLTVAVRDSVSFLAVRQADEKKIQRYSEISHHLQGLHVAAFCGGFEWPLVAYGNVKKPAHWPHAGDLWAAKLHGRVIPDAAQRIEAGGWDALLVCAGYDDELYKQADLLAAISGKEAQQITAAGDMVYRLR